MKDNNNAVADRAPLSDMTADKWFGVICSEVKEHAWLQRFVVYIQARTGTKHANIVTFHHDGTAEAEKRQVYEQCMRAYWKKDSALLEGVAEVKGQAEAEVEGETEAPPASVPVTPTAVPVQHDPVADLIRSLQALVKPTPEEPGVSEDRARRIAQDVVMEHAKAEASVRLTEERVRQMIRQEVGQLLARAASKALEAADERCKLA